MNFEVINYMFLLEDFVYCLAVGGITAFFNQVLCVFISKNKILVFLKDFTLCCIFSVLMFSFIISFANYKTVRIYHIFFGITGFLMFNLNFSNFFQKIFYNIFQWLKYHILCCKVKILAIIMERKQKMLKKAEKQEKITQNTPLPKQEDKLYNIYYY